MNLSNIFPQKSVAPSYKKTLRGNQGQFKLGTNRNLAWLKPVPSDNLVISFSDDDSETDSGVAKQYRSKSTRASSQVAHKTGITMQTRITREEVPQQKIHAANLGSSKWSANQNTLRNSGAGRGSGATYSRREPPSCQVTHLKSTQKDVNGAGVKSADDKLESLRHKIAARENELKVQKRPMSPGFVKDANFSSDQIRPPLEKIGFEASNSGGCVHPDAPFGHDDRPVNRLKPNQQCINNQASGDLATLVPTGSSFGNDNLISSGRRDHIENEITMNYLLMKQNMQPQQNSWIKHILVVLLRTFCHPKVTTWLYRMVVTIPQLNIMASLQRHHLLASNLWLKILVLWFLLPLSEQGSI